MAEQMKDSGISWIGQVPKSWNVKRVKYLAQLKGRIGWQGLTSDEYTDVGPYLITGVDFENGGINWDNCVHITEERWAEAPEIHIKNGDLLITKDGTVGKVAVVDNLDGKASLNSGVLVIRTQEGYDKEFLYWVLQSEEFWTWFRLKNAGNSTIIHLYQNDFAEFSYAFPKMPEQKVIADFLDRECAQIDSIAADLEKQIELLQQYKKSLITETVTKGLDKSAPMKDSGIEWIGKIPQHWDLKRTKYLAAKIGSGKTPKGGAEIYEDSGVVFIRSQNVHDDGLYLDDVKYISDQINNEMSGTKLMTGDILFNITGASIGRCCIYSIPEQGNVNQHVCIIRTNQLAFNHYLRYVMNSDIGKCETAINQMGGNRDSLTFEQIGSFFVPVPPLDEQKESAKFLDRELEKINEIINIKKKQIESSTRHKKSLIYEYVTGKKRVKEAQ